jgi:hypothetical protein
MFDLVQIFEMEPQKQAKCSKLPEPDKIREVLIDGDSEKKLEDTDELKKCG